MAAPKLVDPILNDLSGMITGRLSNKFSHPAQTRYLTHLQRLDTELAEARKRTKRSPIGVNDELIAISNQQLQGMRQDIERLSLSLVNVTAQAAAFDQKAQAFVELESALFNEFGPHMASVEGTTAVDIVLGLLRLWAPRAETQGVAAADAAAEAPHDQPDETGADPDPGSPAGEPPAGGRGRPGRGRA